MGQVGALPSSSWINGPRQLVRYNPDNRLPSSLQTQALALTDQPVCGGSMNTRSKWSSQVSGLSTTA